MLADVVTRGAPQERQQAALVIMEGAAGNDPTVSRLEQRTNPCSEAASDRGCSSASVVALVWVLHRQLMGSVLVCLPLQDVSL